MVLDRVSFLDTPMANIPPLFRIAPTPSGWLHQGNLWNFLLVKALANLWHAPILLRIDDLDNTRFREPYLENIFQVLELLQIDFLGPKTPQQFHETWSQHHRMPLYTSALATLEQKGLLKSSQLSRKQLQDPSLTTVVPHHSSDKNWYLPVETNESVITVMDQIRGPLSVNLEQEMPMIVVRKKDGLPSYQLASIVDDLHFKVTHIVRGEDLLPSSAAQQWIASCITDSPWTPWWIHHSLVLDPKGQKLSKSAGKSSQPPHWTVKNIQEMVDSVSRFIDANAAQLTP